MHQARIFNELVYNTDANLGNLLITKDWKIALIDFTRAFRIHKNLREPKNIANPHFSFAGLAEGRLLWHKHNDHKMFQPTRKRPLP